MTNFEKFGLATSIIGLVVDMSALVTFFGGLWNIIPQNTVSSNLGFPVLVQIIMGLIVVYSWFMISWVLLRRKILHNTKTATINSDMTATVTMGVGILIAPILIGLCVAIAQTNIQVNTDEYQQNSIVHATQTSQAFQATVTADPSTHVSIFNQPKTVAELTIGEQNNSWWGYVLGGIGLLFLLFLCIWGSLYFLMPFVYPDINYK